MKTPSVINAPLVTPSVSFIIPTDKGYPQYKINEKKLQTMLKNTEKKLLDEFPKSKAVKTIDKLHKLIASIDHKRLSKGLAIYASPEMERIVYLPFPVKEKIIVDSSFEVRDLLYSTKNSIDYMVLLIGSHHPEIYHGYNNTLVKMDGNGLPPGIESVERDYPSRVSNFSDPAAIKEANLDKYLKEIDRALTKELKQMKVPVIVCGPGRSIGHFKNITRNSKQITDFVEGDYSHSPREVLYKAIEPSIVKQWEKRQQKTFDALEDAMSKNACISGLESVSEAVVEKRGGLLVVEKDYSRAVLPGEDQDILLQAGVAQHDPSVLQDAVDDLIELVLKNGGDVAFVSNGKLKDHNKIALITYY